MKLIFSKCSWALVLFYIVGILCATQFASADEIALSVEVQARNEIVSVFVQNTGRDPADGLLVEIELDKRRYVRPSVLRLEPGKKSISRFNVELPKKPGIYALITRVNYYNSGVPVSLLNVGSFRHRTDIPVLERCALPDLKIRGGGLLKLKKKYLGDLRILVPREVSLRVNTPVLQGGLKKNTVWERLQTSPKQTIKTPSLREGSSRISGPSADAWLLQNERPQLALSYEYFTVHRIESSEAVQTRICRGRLQTFRDPKRLSQIPSWLLSAGALVGLVLSVALWRAGSWRTRYQHVVLIRYFFSAFVVSAALLLARNAAFIPDLLLPWLELERPANWPQLALNSLLTWAYFDGPNYDYFFEYIADPLWIYFVFGNYFLLAYWVRPQPNTDKYWHLLSWIFSRASRDNRAQGSTNLSLSGVGARAILVKFFYVPLLCSWAINNVFHQINLTNAMAWNFQSCIAYIIATLIFIDVAIFAAGYLVELPRLNNQIRSVEPTLFGWFICLICYPPFNAFAFQLFDYPLLAHWSPPAPGVTIVAQCVTVFLWGIYVWATVALGWKASNLTNRGIVEHGPYRYVRHPAYISKVGVWAISSISGLSPLNFYLVVSFAVVYALRAWTEERHLRRDPEYLAYAAKVRSRFIPGVF